MYSLSDKEEELPTLLFNSLILNHFLKIFLFYIHLPLFTLNMSIFVLSLFILLYYTDFITCFYNDQQNKDQKEGDFLSSTEKGQRGGDG